MELPHPTESEAAALSFAELGLRLRVEVFRLLSPEAARWVAAAPLVMDGRPPRLPAADTSHEVPWQGRGPREWRIYTRRQADPRKPFSLRAVVPDAPPYDRAVDAAFQAFPEPVAGPGRAVGLCALDRERGLECRRGAACRGGLGRGAGAGGRGQAGLCRDTLSAPP
jgi:hypothetical protein